MYMNEVNNATVKHASSLNDLLDVRGGDGSITNADHLLIALHGIITLTLFEKVCEGKDV